MQGSISKTFLYHSSVTWKTPPHFWCHFWHLGNISFCSQLLCYIWLEKKMYWTFLMFHWDWGTDPQNKLEGEGMTFSQKKVLKGKKKGRGWLFPKNNSWKEIVPKKYLQAVMPKKNCAMEEKKYKTFYPRNLRFKNTNGPTQGKGGFALQHSCAAVAFVRITERLR